ncbi:MAG: exopolyphosphatase [Cyclobacteriaceae bacterium]|nr:exopolyphosphatase [Cyclobacteriaceae bacterium]
MKKRLAIIDLGTNTFHLLLAEQQETGYSIFHTEKLAVRLGVRGINEDRIQDDAVLRAVDALKKFKNTIDDAGISVIHAVGTSALRNARNSQAVTETIKKETGIDITIISGEKEAEFIYYGVRTALELGKDNSLVMDIGGGSVEFIIGNQAAIHWKQSIEIGGQRLLEKFQHHDPITKEEIISLDRYLETALPTLFDALALHKPTTLAGSSGTFDTLSDIHCIRQGILKSKDAPETPLTLESFYIIYEELISKNRAERLLIPGMVEMRVDMIVVTCCLIRFILERYAFEKIRVSGYSLKEGVLAYLGGVDGR